MANRDIRAIRSRKKNTGASGRKFDALPGRGGMRCKRDERNRLSGHLPEEITVSRFGLESRPTQRVRGRRELAWADVEICPSTARSVYPFMHGCRNGASSSTS